MKNNCNKYLGSFRLTGDVKVYLFLFLLAFTFVFYSYGQDKQRQKLHIIIIGAHPDDPDKVGGTAYKWAQLSHDVLMVSLTNGDAGHQSIKAKELAKIRREEARKAGEVIGIRYITLNNHDGQYHQHKSQMYEWLPFNSGTLDKVPVSDSDRRAWIGETRKRGSDTTPYRDKLIELYGKARGAKIEYCESFQDSGYGTKLTKENIRYYFPFLPL